MSFINRLLVIIIFFAILIGVIALARGYRVDLKKKSLNPTGILAVSSTPKPAKIYIDGALAGATDMNITLPPGNYQVEIKKEGYTSWNKKVNLKGELVISLDALLFPANPSLSPLTNLGIIKAVPLDQTEKIIVFAEDGIYLFEASKKPLSIIPPLKLIMAKKNLPEKTDFASSYVYLSPDFKQAIFEFAKSKNETVSYLLSLEEENKTLFDTTDSKNALLDAWTKEKERNDLKILETFPREIAKVASDSFHILSFSPNETKILYQASRSVVLPLALIPPLIAANQTQDSRALKKDSLYVYDKKEDKNFEISIPASIFQPPASILWFPDSKHLVFVEGKKISVVDYDGTNRQSVYSGPLESSFFTTTSDGTLIILANLNPEVNKFPDVYAVGIR